MQAEDIVKRAAPNGELFATRQSEDEGLTRLIERLQARLGAGQVQRLVRASRTIVPSGRVVCSEARAAVARSPAGSAARRAAAIAAQRTGEADDALRHRRGRSGSQPVRRAARRASARGRLLDGRPLSLLSGPERIEAGWWDAGLAERDYFIAEAADGALVWIYRARLPLSRSATRSESGWFLHGRFG